MRRGISIAVVLAVVLALAPTAGGTELTGSNFSFETTATVKPKRLPKRGSAPVTLAMSGRIITALDRTQLPALRSVELRLDRQLTLTSKGLATCTSRDLTGIPEAQARRRCGKALVGSGTLSTENTFAETPPAPQKIRFLLFNAKGSGLLMYAYVAYEVYEGVPTTVVARGRASKALFRIPLPTVPFSGTTAFQVRIGRTWRDQGRPLSYLSGRCSTGQLSNQATLTFAPRATLSGAVLAGCVKGD